MSRRKAANNEEFGEEIAQALSKGIHLILQ